MAPKRANERLGTDTTTIAYGYMENLVRQRAARVGADVEGCAQDPDHTQVQVLLALFLAREREARHRH